MNFKISELKLTYEAALTEKEFLPAATKLGKVMFLQASVILLTGGGLPQCMLGYHLPLEEIPPGGDPLEETPPLSPWEETPPGGDPPGRSLPRRRPPLGGDPPWEETPPGS